MMVEVVERAAPARGAQIDGVAVAGKTGTAQTGVEGETRTRGSSPSRRPTHPRYAVAVIVEHGGDFGSEATGGEVAAPIAKQMLAEPAGAAMTLVTGAFR